MHLRQPTDDIESWKNEFSENPSIVKRPAVNFSHLAQEIQTIEFRCFTATYDRSILKDIIEFPAQWIRAALTNDPDPARLVRDKRWQTTNTMTSPNEEIPRKTTLYHQGRKVVIRNIMLQLVSRTITVADLNYPKYWTDRGFE
jgi:hypothetical protein